MEGVEADLRLSAVRALYQQLRDAGTRLYMQFCHVHLLLLFGIACMEKEGLGSDDNGLPDFDVSPV